jgi:hypothetical protein
MTKVNLLILIPTFLVLSTFGQAQSVEKKIVFVANKVTRNIQIILPISLSDRLTKLQISSGYRKNFSYQSDNLKRFFRKVEFLRIAEYAREGIKKSSNGKTIGSMISHRAWYPAVLYKKKLYVFTESNSETDAEIFNIFLRRAKLKIQNEQEALELANLYFLITRGYFENRGKRILSKVEDVPLSYREAKENETKRLQEIIVSPTSKMIDGSYEVELFTWEMVSGEVKKWNFKIQPDAQVEVESTIIGKL